MWLQVESATSISLVLFLCPSFTVPLLPPTFLPIYLPSSCRCFFGISWGHQSSFHNARPSLSTKCVYFMLLVLFTLIVAVLPYLDLCLLLSSCPSLKVMLYQGHFPSPTGRCIIISRVVIVDMLDEYIKCSLTCGVFCL